MQRPALAFTVNILGVTQILSWGAIYYAISVLAKPMAEELGWSLGFIFTGFSLSLLIGGLLAKPVARLIDARGGRLIMVAGSIVAALGLALLGLAREPVLYLLAWAILGLASRLTLYDAAFATLVEIYGLGARRAISLLTLYGGLASTIYWPLAHYMNEHLGWRGAWLASAGLVLVLCTPLHALLPPKRDWDGADAANGEAPRPPDPPPLVPPEQKAFAVLMLGVALGLNSFVFTALSAHFIPALVMMGVASATAVWVASIKGVFQTLGRLAELVWGARLNPFHLSLLAIGGMPAAFVAFFLGGGGVVALVVFSVLYGIANGLVTIVRGGVPLALFGRAGYAQVLASIATPGLILTAAAPTAFALLLESVGPQMGFLFLMALSALAFAAVAFMAFRFRGA